jgi:hypothetical protein
MQWKKSQSWKQFNVADSIVTVKEALKELKQDSVNACWKKLQPEAVKNSTKYSLPLTKKYKKLLTWHTIEGERLSAW